MQSSGKRNCALSVTFVACVAYVTSVNLTALDGCNAALIERQDACYAGLFPVLQHVKPQWHKTHRQDGAQGSSLEGPALVRT